MSKIRFLKYKFKAEILLFKVGAKKRAKNDHFQELKIINAE